MVGHEIGVEVPFFEHAVYLSSVYVFSLEMLGVLALYIVYTLLVFGVAAHFVGVELYFTEWIRTPFTAYIGLFRFIMAIGIDGWIRRFSGRLYGVQ